MKTDKVNLMTDRQARQMDKLGLLYDREKTTIHEAARRVSQYLQKLQGRTVHERE